MSQLFNKLRFLMKALFRDGYNIIKYGLGAPKYAETIWIIPSEVKGIVSFGKKHSGKVVNFDEFIDKNKVINLLDDNRIKSCIDHWTNRVPWEKTTDFKDKLSRINSGELAWDSDCKTREDLFKKYRKLDDIFNEVKANKSMKTRKEINKCDFRELNTFGISIDKFGQIWLGSGGYHRFAIAYILQLKKVPARIGLVDYRKVKQLNKYRKF